MRTAFEVAVGVSYYVGKLWDIVTDPDVASGRNPKNTDKTCVVRYGQPDENNVVVSGNVPEKIVEMLEKINTSESLKLSEADDLTRSSLRGSLATLHKILSKEDPAEGYTTAFSNVKKPLTREMPKIEALLRSFDA